MLALRGWLVGTLVVASTPIADRLVAQQVPGVDVVVPATGTQDVELERRRELADGSRGGDPRVTIDHLWAVLGRSPGDAEALRGLCDAAVADGDASFVFATLLAASQVDAKGKLSIQKNLRSLLEAYGEVPGELAEARSDALKDLEKLCDKLPKRGRKALGRGLVARWASEVAQEIGHPMPVRLEAGQSSFEKALAGSEPARQDVIDALVKLARLPKATGTGSEDESEADLRARDRAVRAARILEGLAAQSRFDDLEGPDPLSLDKEAADARDTIERVRGLAAEKRAPWTVDELRGLSGEERRQFTEEHSTWANPGLAATPTGHYLVETICGFDTLLAAADTLDEHHERLSNWYGKDPFANRQGVVRIEPEHAGLEARGAPYWWAGGFQSGDLTTVRAAWTNANGLGRTLTHELTHRFDGTIYAFLPAWMTEGRAVWTGASYSSIEDDEFVEDYVRAGAIQTPFVDGYGGRRKFEQLLTGDIDDYRDNYSAGYALFTWLKSGKVEGKTVFAGKLEDYMRGMRGGRKDPVGYFEKTFADGRDGRPKGLDEFIKIYREFLELCYRVSWGEPEPRRKFDALYRRGIPGPSKRPAFEDEPTWSWARGRAEPWFGQDHAAAAAWLFAEVQQHEDAAKAAVWALGVDGLDDRMLALAADELSQAGAGDAAWAARALRARRRGAIANWPEEAPFRSKIGGVHVLVEQLRKVSRTVGQDANKAAALWFAAEHDGLARSIGESTRLGTTADDRGETLLPQTDPERLVGASGWIDDRLTGFEDHRVKGLWFEDDDRDLYLGRKKKATTTGGLERRAAGREVFVRSREWVSSGRVVLRTRVELLTSYVNGSIVLAHERRDRAVRLSFTAGNYRYAIGRSESGGKVEKVNFRLNGGYERASRFSGSSPRKQFDFDRPVSSFLIELRVDGPRVELFVDEEFVFDWVTQDGRPIEGHLGFAVKRGAYRAQAPMVVRADRHVPRTRDGWVLQTGRSYPELAVGGDGAILLWVPGADEEGEVDTDRIVRRTRRGLRRIADSLSDRTVFPQERLVSLPPDLDDETRSQLIEQIKARLGDDYRIVQRPDGGSTGDALTVLFIDGGGVLRAGGRAEGGLPQAVQSWARRHRARVPR